MATKGTKLSTRGSNQQVTRPLQFPDARCAVDSFIRQMLRSTSPSFRRSGEIGIRSRLKICRGSLPVGVQVPSPAFTDHTIRRPFFVPLCLVPIDLMQKKQIAAWRFRFRLPALFMSAIGLGLTLCGLQGDVYS